MVSTKAKVLSLCLCFIECGLLGGAFLAWPSLTYVLQGDGIYSYLCITNSSESQTKYDHRNESSTGNTTVICTAQKLRLSIGYTVAMSILGIGAIPVGLAFDRWGLRPIRTFGVVVGVMAYLLMSLVDHGREWIMFPSAACLGLSSYVIVVTNFHVALLAGPKTSTVIGLYSGALNFAFTFQGIKIAYDNGIPRRYSLGFVGALWSIVLFTTWFLLPPFKINTDQSKRNPESKSQLGSPLNNVDSSLIPLKNIREETKEKGIINEGNKPLHQEGLKDYLLRLDFVLVLYFFCTLHVRVVFIISSYDIWISNLVSGSKDKVSYFIDVMSYGMMMGAVLNPLAGIINDVFRAKTLEEKRRDGTFMVPVLVLVILLTIAASVPAYFNSESAIFVCVAFFALVKPWIYSTLATYVILLTPSHSFGSILGVVRLATGITTYMCNAYMVWEMHAQSYIPVTTTHIITIILASSLPIKILYNSKSSVIKGQKPFTNDTGEISTLQTCNDKEP